MDKKEIKREKEMFCNVSELIGKTLVKVKLRYESDEIFFEDTEGNQYVMYHMQDCCEDVFVEDICGDFKNLIGSEITMAEEIVDANYNREALEGYEDNDSYTWTFYKFATLKGYVTIRWYGTSNGYYSESVDFDIYRVVKDE